MWSYLPRLSLAHAVLQREPSKFHKLSTKHQTRQQIFQPCLHPRKKRLAASNQHPVQSHPRPKQLFSTSLPNSVNRFSSRHTKTSFTSLSPTMEFACHTHPSIRIYKAYINGSRLCEESVTTGLSTAILNSAGRDGLSKFWSYRTRVTSVRLREFWGWSIHDRYLGLGAGGKEVSRWWWKIAWTAIEWVFLIVISSLTVIKCFGGRAYL